MFIVGGNWPSVTLCSPFQIFLASSLLRLWLATGYPRVCVSVLLERGCGTRTYTVRYLNNDDGSDIRTVWSVKDEKLGRDDNPFP